MTEAQKTLYYIAENMRMDKSISKDGYEHFQQAIEALNKQETAYWIEDWVMGLFKCPVCHDTYLGEDFKAVGSWHYCPNCGKRLEVKSANDK